MSRISTQSSIAFAGIWCLFGAIHAHAAPSLGSLPKVSLEQDLFSKFQNAYLQVTKSPKVFALTQTQGNTLAIDRSEKSQEVETTKFQSYYRGLEVVGSTAFHHQGPAGEQITDQLAQFDLNVNPTLSSESAGQIIRGLANNGLELDQAPELKILPGEDRHSARLVYWTQLPSTDEQEGREIILDAHTGEVLVDISSHLTIAPINVLTTLGTNCQEINPNDGSPASINIKQCKTVVNAGAILSGADSSAKQALANSQKTLNYYQDHQKRNSYDGKGGTVVNIIHVGKDFDNAFWDTQRNIMAYGDGDGKLFGDMTKAVDVAGHETTHGVTNATAKLPGWGEGGAMNEAFSDYFGKLIANDGTWIMGADAMAPGSGLKGIRDLAKPSSMSMNRRDASGKKTAIPYPEKMADTLKVGSQRTCNGSNDNCWVHFNSTVVSHLFYNIQQKLGQPRAEKLVYLTLTQYLSASSKFADLKKQMLAACAQIETKDACNTVDSLFDDAGY